MNNDNHFFVLNGTIKQYNMLATSTTTATDFSN
jgi:hypothetical protein